MNTINYVYREFGKADRFYRPFRGKTLVFLSSHSTSIPILMNKNETAIATYL